MIRFKGLAWMGLCAIAAVTGCGSADEGSSSMEVHHAAFTTFDETLGGCHPGSTNGINCNHYVCQDRVYINGGPNHSGPSSLPPGSYYFAVFAPGSQHGGALDNSRLLSSDSTANRTFTIDSSGALQYSGTHPEGTSPNGQTIIRVAPFAETSNPGGVYILAICPTGSADPRDCKFDEFKTERCAQDGGVSEDAGSPDSSVCDDAGKKVHKDDP